MKTLTKRIEENASISDIKMAVETLEPCEYENAILLLKQDSRRGVLSLATKLEKTLMALERERTRMEMMFQFEREAKAMGYCRIAGVDEVGRGPLVGPVVAAAVILPDDEDWSYIDDSKKLSEAKREAFYDKITSKAIAWGVGIVDNVVIDEINILNATKVAMKEALATVDADYLLIDALTLDDIPIVQKGIIKGDAKSASIAAASIVAKVTRDRLMAELHEQYPMYDFANNKGYGTPAHYDAIRAYGMLDAHRRSFLKNMR